MRMTKRKQIFLFTLRFSAHLHGFAGFVMTERIQRTTKRKHSINHKETIGRNWLNLLKFCFKKLKKNLRTNVLSNLEMKNIRQYLQ